MFLQHFLILKCKINYHLFLGDEIAFIISVVILKSCIFEYSYLNTLANKSNKLKNPRNKTLFYHCKSEMTNFCANSEWFSQERRVFLFWRKEIWVDEGCRKCLKFISYATDIFKWITPFYEKSWNLVHNLVFKIIKRRNILK